NATVNTIAALTDLPHVSAFAEVGAPTDLGLLVRDLMDEGKRVAAAAGVELHEDPWEMNVHAVRRGETEAAAGAYAHVPSIIDDEGRDILTWIDGDTFTERSQMNPYIGDPPVRITFGEEQVAAAMRLLRRYHDTFGGAVVCHGDFGPWNIVWRRSMPFAVIDF